MGEGAKHQLPPGESRRGNQNRRTRGWFSHLDPAPTEAIVAAAIHAADSGDAHTVERALSALERRQARAEAQQMRLLLRAIGVVGEPGGQPGNQNGRTRGWRSRHQPVPATEILAAVEPAVEQRDSATLRAAADGLRRHGRHREASVAGMLAALIEADRIIASSAKSSGKAPTETTTNDHADITPGSTGIVS